MVETSPFWVKLGCTVFRTLTRHLTSCMETFNVMFLFLMFEYTWPPEVSTVSALDRVFSLWNSRMVTGMWIRKHWNLHQHSGEWKRDLMTVFWGFFWFWVNYPFNGLASCVWVCGNRYISRAQLTGRLLVSKVDMLRRVAGLVSSTFFFATLSSRLLGGT